MTVLFAMKHEKPEVMDIGLITMHALNTLVAGEPSVRTIFYKQFYTAIIKDTVAVMTDYRHMSGFKLQGLILQQLLAIVQEQGVLTENIL